MKILLVSDIHKSYRFYKQIDETIAIDWLLYIIDKEKPDVLISAGDWDEGVTEEDFYEIERRVKLFTVYGNHENFPIIKPRAMVDGKIYEIGGLAIAGINGLIGEGKIFNIPPDKAENIARKIKRKLNNKRLDILIAHQPPYLPEVYPDMREDEGSVLMYKIMEELRPRIFFNGHMTGGPYSYYELSFTKYLRVDSSQVYKCYAILDIETKEITIYRDDEKLMTFKL